MSASKKAAAPADKVELYDRLIAAFPEIERKGAANPYTSVNGNMFSYLHPSGAMALKLPSGPREEFLEEFQTKLFEAYGIIQKEYVTVPEALLRDTERLIVYMKISWEYAKTLKPKPSKAT